MPIYHKKDKIGKYYKYGQKGKKYYYHTKNEQIIAYNKALKQAAAIQRSRFKKYLF
jgi:hypothetical protein